MKTSSADPMSMAWIGRLKQGDIIEACLKRGWNQADFARFMGWSSTKAGAVINLRWVPKTLTDDEVRKLLELTGKLPDEIWPEWARDKRWLDADKRAAIIRSVTPAQLGEAGFGPRLLPSPDDVVEHHEATDLIGRVLETLTPREQTVIRLRYGIGCDEQTYEEIAVDQKVTRERIRQIEAKALRKLRHKSRVKKLRPLIPDGWLDDGDPDLPPEPPEYRRVLAASKRLLAAMEAGGDERARVARDLVAELEAPIK